MTASLLNGSYSDSAGWADDPFVPPSEVDAAIDAVERSRLRQSMSFAALRPVIGRSATVDLNKDSLRLMNLAVERVLDYQFANFARGELSKLLGLPPSRISRALRGLKDAGIIKPTSDTQHIYFLVEGDLDT